MAGRSSRWARTLISETIGSLVIEQREQVVAHAIEAPAGGWIVVSMEGCGDIGT